MILLIREATLGFHLRDFIVGSIKKYLIPCFAPDMVLHNLDFQNIII